MVKQIFVNLPVVDLEKAIEFFKNIGFTFNPKFTDEKAACIEIGENIFAMLLKENFFKTFTKKEIGDTSTTTEVINAFNVGSREEVDKMMEKVLTAGGTEHREKQDYGWMYNRGFTDLDGHLWEVFFMDESKAPSEMQS